MSDKNRFLRLFNAPDRNGVDFVEMIEAVPTDLVVHFINGVDLRNAGLTATITGGDSIPTIRVLPIKPQDWATDQYGRPLLTLHPEREGDFSDYTLRLSCADAINPPVDLYFSAATFSFKVFCPSDFDCVAPARAPLPLDEAESPAIDYLAKDFGSFVRALSDFSAQRYPGWVERGEADFGVMFMETLAGLGDKLSYQQDRVAAEATLETATERRSLVGHARLVDYEPAPATSARTTLLCTVSGTSLPAGIEVLANDPDGGVVPFEIGTSLSDQTIYAVDPRWNLGALKPYWWDDEAITLPAGATEMWVEGIGHGLFEGQALLLETDAPVSADPPLRTVVHIARIEFAKDFLYGQSDVTRIAWRRDEGLAVPRDLRLTRVAGNLLPATQGQRRREFFVVDPPAAQRGVGRAFARAGANAAPGDPPRDYRFSLGESPLVWLGDDDPATPPRPDIHLSRLDDPEEEWSFMRSLLNAAEEERVYTLEPATWRPVQTLADGTAQLEYDGDDGETIRFGNGTFGSVPAEGSSFELTYRIGVGPRGNVAADAINIVDPAWSGLLGGVSNPFPAAGGADRETAEQIRRRAPYAFQARQYRAVRTEDYEEQAERLGWVQQAGTAFRWTGSWFSVFTAIDPKGSVGLTPEGHIEVIDLLNRRRLAGYESFVPPPRYRSIDLDIKVCAQADAFQGVVEKAVLDRLAPSPTGSGDLAFFLADRFTFGTPLERSQIESVVQSVPGVAGVLSIQYRERGVVPQYVELPDTLPIRLDEILRIDNDPSFPERGAIAVNVVGGR